MTFDAENAQTQGTNSLIKILANIFISFIGVGILGLPYAFKEAGLFNGILILTCVGLLSIKSMLLIIDCKYKIMSSSISPRSAPSAVTVTSSTASTDKQLLKDDNVGDGVASSENSTQINNLGSDRIAHTLINYSDVGFYACGKPGQILVNYAIMISQIGFCCGYLIYVIENVKLFYPRVLPWNVLIVLLPLLFLLCIIRSLGKLAYFSFIGQFTNLFALLVVLWFDFSQMNRIERTLEPASLRGLAFFLTVSMYCYEGAGLILSLEMSVHSNRKPFFKMYFKLMLLFVTFLYIFFGSAGYLSFGPKTKSIITSNLPNQNSLFNLSLLVKASMCISVLLTYPMMMFPVSQLIDAKFSISNHIAYGNAVRGLLVCASGLIVITVPQFDTLISFIGATCCALLGFILPGAFHLQVSRHTRRPLQTLLDVALVLFGLLAMAVGLWDAALRFLHNRSAPSAAVGLPTPPPPLHYHHNQHGNNSSSPFVQPPTHI